MTVTLKKFPFYFFYKSFKVLSFGFKITEYITYEILSLIKILERRVNLFFSNFYFIILPTIPQQQKVANYDSIHYNERQVNIYKNSNVDKQDSQEKRP